MAILWRAGHDTDSDWLKPDSPKTPKPTFAGAVLGTSGRDVRIMSDVWSWITSAVVWDGTTVKEIPVASSECGGIFADVTIDATDDVKAAVAIFRAAAAVAAAKVAAAASVDRAIAEARRIAVGKDVTVVKGRKIAKGTMGRVFWMGSSRFGMRVGLELADGSRVFTALGNVEVTSPDDHLDIDDLMARLAA